MKELSPSACQPGSNRARCLISLLALSTCLVTHATLATTLVRADLSGAANCMDGSPPAFYYDPTVTSDRWIIVLEGSNLCKGADGIEADTAADCQTWCNMDEADPEGMWYDVPQVCDSKQAGSSKWKQTLNKGELFSDNIDQNPEFHDVQKIFVPSCSGDGWMGNAMATPDPSFGDLFFHGRLIIDDVIDHLTQTGVDCVQGDSADPASQTCEKIDVNSDVLFGGESRGAVGTWANVDRVCDHLNTLGVRSCRGISASFFPGYYKNRLEDDGTQTGVAIPALTWPEWVAISRARYGFQGITHSRSCRSMFNDTFDPAIDPVSDYELDVADRSRDLCYTELGLLMSVQTPMFVSFNRFNAPGSQQWFDGCNLGHPYCYNNTIIRDWEMEDIAGWLPSTFSIYLAASSKHLYMVTKDGKCDDGRGGCWHHVNDMKQLDTGVVQAVSKHDVLAEFLLGNVGKYWDVDDYRH